MARKKILVIFYSLSGQTLKAIQSIADPIRTAGHRVDIERIETMSDRYRIPYNPKLLLWEWGLCWSGQTLRVPIKPVIPPLPPEEYDAVIVGYQTWYLEPSIPVASWLETRNARDLLYGKPIFSVVTARSTWKQSLQRFTEAVSRLGGHVVDNFAICASNPSPHNIVLLSHMLFNGRDPNEGWRTKLGPFGIGEEGVESARLYGQMLALRFSKEEHDTMTSALESNPPSLDEMDHGPQASRPGRG